MPESARSVWVRSGAERQMTLISETRRSRSQASISEARRSSNGRAPGRRASSPQARPNDSTRPRWSRQRRPPAPFFRVAMGDNGIKRTDEDELCAIHLRNRLEDRLSDADAIRRLILAGGEVERFRDPARPYLHPEDVDIALDIDRYDFAIRVVFEKGRPVA